MKVVQWVAAIVPAVGLLTGGIWHIATLTNKVNELDKIVADYIVEGRRFVQEGRESAKFSVAVISRYDKSFSETCPIGTLMYGFALRTKIG